MNDRHPRQVMLDRFAEGYLPEELDKHIDVERHRFIAVEAIKTRRTSDSYLTGHETVRAACEFLEQSEAESPYTPQFILDLETGEKIEVDVIVRVAPKRVEAVAVLMPGDEAEEIMRWHDRVKGWAKEGGFPIDGRVERAFKRIGQAISHT